MFINAPSLTDEEWSVQIDALKRKGTTGTLVLEARSKVELSAFADRSLADFILGHPTLDTLSFRRFSINDFNAVMLAIEQSEKMSRLEVRNCFVTPRLAENICFLLKENSLETLELNNNVDKNNVTFEMDLGSALGHNHSLKELVITTDSLFTDAIMTGSTVEGIARLLSRNQGLQVLELSLHAIENSSDLIAQVARSAKGHASLWSLSLNNADELEENAAAAIGDFISNAPALEVLDLAGCNMGNNGVRQLLNGLPKRTLTQLNLSDTQIGDTGASALAAAISENGTLSTLDLAMNDIGEAGARALVVALETNTSLRNLDIRYNKIGNGAVRIAQALTRNCTLEKIDMDCSGESLDAVATCIPHMSGLKGLFLYEINNFTADHGHAFCGAFSRNAVLEQSCFFQGDGCSPDCATNIVKTIKHVNHLLTLNRGGRRILSSEREVPRSLWPRVLALSKDKPDVIYFFLKEKPDVFFKKGALGKRKRHRASCVIS
jgi:Ran GTPase-activating protein (RanGAP) involved in mRNA processing and transport